MARAKRSKPRSSSEARKKQILDAAFACFMRRGFHKTTIDDIARKAGLAKGTVYWHFKDKQDVFISFYMAWAQGYFEDFAKILNSSRSARGKIYELGAYMLKRAEDQPETNRAIHDLWLQAFDHPKTYTLFMRLYRQTIDQLESLVREGINKKELRPDINPRLAAFMVATVMDNLDHIHMMGFEEIDPFDYWQQVSRVLFEGIAPQAKNRR